jgi:hypothetical protein
MRWVIKFLRNLTWREWLALPFMVLTILFGTIAILVAGWRSDPLFENWRKTYWP